MLLSNYDSIDIIKELLKLIENLEKEFKEIHGKIYTP